MQGLRGVSALFRAPEKAGVRQPILILSPFDWGPPRMERLRSIFALFLAPKKAGVRRPLLIFSPRLALGTPENARVAWRFRPFSGPRECKGEAANSEFVPFLLGNPENVGVA